MDIENRKKDADANGRAANELVIRKRRDVDDLAVRRRHYEIRFGGDPSRRIAKEINDQKQKHARPNRQPCPNTAEPH